MKTVSRRFRKHMSIPVDTAHLAEVRRIVEEAARAAAFAETEAHLIALAVDEAVTNVIKHSYSGGKKVEVEGKVDLFLSADGERLEVLVRDTGESINLKKLSEDLDIGEHVRQGRKSGLGIYLMRRIMDEVDYSFRRGEVNELRMVKYVDRSSKAAKNELA